MSDYLTPGEANTYVFRIADELPDAEAIVRDLEHYVIDVTLPNGQTTMLDGETGDLAGDIEDLKALAEGRQP